MILLYFIIAILVCALLFAILIRIAAAAIRNADLSRQGLIQCPNCMATVELDDNEKKTKQFDCPGCHKHISLKYNIIYWFNS